MTRAGLAGAALLLLLGGPATGDLLLLREGTEVLGTLRTLDPTRLVFEAEDGAVLELAREDAARVELHRDLSGTDARRPEDADDPALREGLRYVAGPEDYPSAGAVNLFLGETVTFAPDGARTREVHNVVRVLRERGEGEGTVPGRWFRDVGAFHLDHGRTWVPDGAGGYTRRGLTDKGVRVAPRFGSVPEYDRELQALHTLPAVDVGSVVDWRYTTTRAAGDAGVPVFYSQVLHLDEPVLRGELVVRVHETLDMVVELTRTEGVARRREEQPGYRVEVFEYRGREPPKDEPRTPPAAEIHPAVYVAPRRTWAEALAPSAGSFAAPDRPGPRAAALLRELVDPSAGPAEVHQSLALWVAREVRLVGVLMRDFSYLPRDLEDVLATRTGNYLDKTWALYALLRLAGVGADLYLVRDHYAGAYPGRVRSLRLFNDALVRVHLPGGKVFRDADEVDLGPEDLPAAFHGARALRVAGVDGPGDALEEIPAPPTEADRSSVRYSTRLHPDGSLTGTRRLEVRGNSARTVRGYRNLSGEDLRNRMERLNHAFHPAAELVSYRLENLGDFTEDVLYERSFRVPGYALRAGDRLMALHLPGLVESAGDVGAATRRFPLAFVDRDHEDREIVVELPPGSRVLYVPEGLELDGEGWSFRSSVSVEEGRVLYRGAYRRTTRRVLPEDYPSYKRMRDLRAREAREWIVVERH